MATPGSPASVTPRPVKCCATADATTQGPCTMCARPTCRACRARVNGQPVCLTCLAQVEEAFASQKAGPGNALGAVVGGLAGALIAGAVWALVAIGTGLAIGYVAVGVGFAAGLGVYLGAGKRRSRMMQGIAVVCALLGLLLGKYFIVAHFVIRDNPEADLSYASPELFGLFIENVGKVLQPFDLLWIFLALGAAVRVTQPDTVRVTLPRPAP